MSTGNPPIPIAFTAAAELNPPSYYNRAVTNVGDDKKDGCMKYVRLGTTGAVISRICLGVMIYLDLAPGEKPMFDWLLGYEQAEPLIKQALDAGITFFDTAEMYSDGSSERFLGKALKKLLPQSRFTRSDLFIASKIAPVRSHRPSGGIGGIQRGLSRKAIFDAVEGSLERLQLDYIDLYIIHRYDADTAPEETMKALHDLVVSGKVRYIGASSMWLWQFNHFQHIAEVNGWTKFISMQNHYNAIYREEEKEMIPYCINSGVALTPWAPLAAGVLTRLSSDQETDRAKGDPIQKSRYYKSGDDEIVQAVRDIAKQRGIPPAQVALAWILSKKGIAAPIIGVTKPHHIGDAVKALHIQLTAEEIKKIEEPYQPHKIVGHN